MKQLLRYSGFAVLLALSLVSCEKEISPSQAESFLKFFGSQVTDRAAGVESLADGGYAFAGTSQDGSGREVATLWITDQYGNCKNGFPKSYSGPSRVHALLSVKGGSEGFLLCGSITSGDLSGKDIYLVRTDDSGEVLWESTFGGSGDQEALHAVLAPSGNFILAGYRMEDAYSRIMLMGVQANGDSIQLGLNYHNPNAENEKASYLVERNGVFYSLVSMEQNNGQQKMISVLSFDEDLSPLISSMDPGAGVSAASLYMDEDERLLVLWNQISQGGRSEVVISEIEVNGLLMGQAREAARMGDDSADLEAARMIRDGTGNYALCGWSGASDQGQAMFMKLDRDLQPLQKQLYGPAATLGAMDLDEGAEDGYIMILGPRSGQEGELALLKTGSEGGIGE